MCKVIGRLDYEIYNFDFVLLAPLTLTHSLIHSLTDNSLATLTDQRPGSGSSPPGCCRAASRCSGAAVSGRSAPPVPVSENLRKELISVPLRLLQILKSSTSSYRVRLTFWCL